MTTTKLVALLLIFLTGCTPEQEPAEKKNVDQVPTPPSPAVFQAPPDHLEPFEKTFGFGDMDEVKHFWRWNQEWDFKPTHARNHKWNNHTFIESTYALVGDFEVTIKGMMGKSYTNSKKPHLLISGREIQVLPNWRKHNLDMTVIRVGTFLTWTINNGEPVVMELTDEQAGPTTVYLRFHNRHTTLREVTLKAESADRKVENEK